MLIGTILQIYKNSKILDISEVCIFIALKRFKIDLETAVKMSLCVEINQTEGFRVENVYKCKVLLNRVIKRFRYIKVGEKCL